MMDINRLRSELESKINSYYKSDDSFISGMLHGQVIRLAHEHYIRTGEFYRRVWNNAQYKTNYTKLKNKYLSKS